MSALTISMRSMPRTPAFTGSIRSRIRLPPGDYLAIALEYVDEVTWQDPECLEQTTMAS